MLHDAVTINSTMNVVDSSTFSDINVVGHTSLSGDTVIEGVLHTTDDIVTHGSVSANGSVTIDDSTTLRDKLDVYGDTKLYKNLSVSADTELYGDVDIVGKTTIHDTLSASDATFSQHVNVHGTSTLHDTLDVTGKVNLNSEMTVMGDAVLHDSLTAVGLTQLQDNLVVSKDVHIGQDVKILGSSTIEQDLHIKGNLRVDGNAWLSAGASGTINVGDSDTDNVVFHADIDSGLTPQMNSTYDLGHDSRHWRTLFVDTVSADDQLRVTGKSYFNDDVLLERDVYIKGNLRVDGNAWLSAGASGTINVGDDDTDNVVFHADIDSDLLPNTSDSHDIGTTEKTWRNIHAAGDMYWNGGDSIKSNSVYNHVNSISGENGFAHLVPHWNHANNGRYVLPDDEVPDLAITTVHRVANYTLVDDPALIARISRGDIVVVTGTTDNLVAKVDNPPGTYNEETTEYVGYEKLFAPGDMVRTFNGVSGPHVKYTVDMFDDEDTDHKFVSQPNKDRWNETSTRVEDLSAYWGTVDQGTTDTLSRTIAHVHGPRRFLTMQSNNPAMDSDWSQVDWEHAFVLPYAAKVRKIQLRGRNTAGRKVVLGIHTNQGVYSGKEYHFFKQSPEEEQTLTISEDYKTTDFTFSQFAAVPKNHTLGVSVSADGEIGPCNMTIVLEYPTYVFSSDARPVNVTPDGSANEPPPSDAGFNVDITGVESVLTAITDVPAGTIAYATDTHNILVYKQTDGESEWIIFASD